MRIGILAVLLAIPATATGIWIGSAEARLEELSAKPGEGAAVAVASASDVEYCNPELKRILRRVLMSCGLVGGERGARLPAGPGQERRDDDRRRLQRAVPADEGARRHRPVRQGQGRARRRGPRARRSGVRRSARRELVLRRLARRRPRARSQHNRDLSKGARRGRDEPPPRAVQGSRSRQGGRPALARRGVRPARDRVLRVEAQLHRHGCTPEEINRSAFVAWIDCQL